MLLLFAKKNIYAASMRQIDFKQKKAGGFLLTRRNHRFRRDSPTNSPREFVRYRDRLPTPSSGGKCQTYKKKNIQLQKI